MKKNGGVIVSDWLTEDYKLKKKDRRTNKKIFEDLKEMGFKGSYRTVCYFIAEWKKAKIAQKKIKTKIMKD